MVVQIPCTYVANTQGSVTASFNTTCRPFYLDSDSDKAFRYVFAYSQVAIHIHPPTSGCSMFLVYDVVNPGIPSIVNTGIPSIVNPGIPSIVNPGIPMPEPPLQDNHEAEAALEQCVRDWNRDLTCEKLALVLERGSHALSAEKKFAWEGLSSVREKAIVRMLMGCDGLDFGFTGM
jgi:hypothetical protein